MSKFFRFRLRTLLVAVALIGCLGGWLAGHEHAHRLEMKAIEEVAGLQGPAIPRASWNEGARFKVRVGVYQDNGKLS